MPLEAQRARTFHWFRLWIQEGYSIRELSTLSGRSRTSVRRIIRWWLTKDPPGDMARWNARLRTARHIIADGTILRRKNGEALYAIMESKSHELLFGGYGIREGARELQQLYPVLAHAGLCPQSATIDGNPQQTKYLSLQWPGLCVQRCIVHVQRQGLRWCRRHPKRTDAKHLRNLYLKLSTVKTAEQRTLYTAEVHQWYDRYGHAILQARRTQGGWVFSDLALATSMLVRSVDNLFHFIDDPGIEGSTNALEGYFSRLKDKYRRHRGLARQSRQRYFQWYFYLQPR